MTQKIFYVIEKRPTIQKETLLKKGKKHDALLLDIFSYYAESSKVIEYLPVCMTITKNKENQKIVDFSNNRLPDFGQIKLSDLINKDVQLLGCISL